MAPTSLTFRVTNPGSSKRPASTDQIPIYVGTAESGDNGVIKSVGRASDAATDLTRGHLLDVIRHAFACGAKTVTYCKVNGATAGSTGTQTATETGTGTVTIGGTLSQRFRVAVEILAAGDLGAGTFRWCLDYYEIPNVDPTWSAETTIPIGGVFTPDGSAMTITFGGTDFAEGDFFVQDVYPAHYTATEVATIPDAVRESAIVNAETFLVFTGEPPPGVANAGAAAANTIATAVIAAVNSLFNTADFFAALCGASEASAASVATAFANTVAVPPFVSAGYGKAYVANPQASPGRGIMALCEHEAVAASRIAGSLISTDPGRTASGALQRIVATNYDARLDGTALHEARIATLTTWQRRLSAGVFVKRQRVLDAATGDFYSWQDIAIMIAALRAVHPVAWLAVLEGFRQNEDGTLDAAEIAGLQSAGNLAIGAALLEPRNARGVRGHVSAASVTVSETAVLPSVEVDFAIRRLGYAEDLEFSLQYAGEV